jgi:hypothetical protein
VSNRKTASISVLLASCLAASPAPAASGDHACTQVVGPTERLACYDVAFPPSADVRKAAASVESQRQAALRDFGLNKMQLRESQPERMQVIAPDRIEAKVVRVREVADGRRSVTLDNDQVWLLTENSSKGWLEDGDQVVVREAAFGSYMLVTPGRIALRARRIQ